MNILAIDPSVNDIGWCVWDGKFFDGGTISFEHHLHLHERLNQFKSQLILLNTISPIHQLVYEEPSFMASAKGKIAAQKGYTINLGIVCGFAMGCLDMGPVDMFGYTPNQWKGTVPKHVTEAKYIRTFGEPHPFPTDHEVDATMMLYHHCQKLRYL